MQSESEIEQENYIQNQSQKFIITLQQQQQKKHSIINSVKPCTQLSFTSNRSHIRQIKKKIPLKKVDVVICCDTTQSMENYLTCSKDIIRIAQKQLIQVFKGDISIQFGFVSYKDHPPEDLTYVTKVHNLSNAEQAIQFIQGLRAEGGGDLPEAVMDGLWQSASSISWRSSSIKYLIHICDAPPHGDKYTGSSNLRRSFMWRFGCPCGLKIEKIAECFNKIGIRYRLVQIGNLLKNMSQIFQKYIKDYEEICVQNSFNLDLYIANMLIQETIPEDIVD